LRLSSGNSFKLNNITKESLHENILKLAEGSNCDLNEGSITYEFLRDHTRNRCVPKVLQKRLYAPLKALIVNTIRGAWIAC
jgi:hypothetical protein